MSIFNDALEPLELLQFHYRTLFGLSALELAQEPIDQMYLNLKIYSMLNKKKSLEAKYAGK